MLIAFNKCDLIQDDITEKIKEIEKQGYIVVPTSAESELALVNAMEKKLIDYTPGADDFNIIQKQDLSEKQLKALNYIKEHILQRFGSTGVQKCIEKSVQILDLIVVYPVEDETHLTDKKNRVLPDAYFMKKGSTAQDLAFKVHTDIGNNFIRAVDAKTKRVIGSDHQLEDGDVIRIVADS
jgi:ribosome-binding ATPase